MMPLIFAISGASLFYALGKGRPGQFIKDKVLRLLVPLVVGMVTLDIIADVPGVACHMASSAAPSSSSCRTTLTGWMALAAISPGRASTCGTWRCCSSLAWSFCHSSCGSSAGLGNASWPGWATVLARPGAAYLLALPVILLLGLMNRNTFLGSLGWGGGSILSHLCFFLSGFVIVSHAGLQNNIQRLRWLSLALVAVLLVTIFTLYMLVGEPAFGTAQYTLFCSLYGLWSWCWVLAILGFGMKHLNFNTPVLQLCQRGRAAVLHPAPAGVALRGLLCRAVGDP